MSSLYTYRWPSGLRSRNYHNACLIHLFTTALIQIPFEIYEKDATNLKLPLKTGFEGWGLSQDLETGCLKLPFWVSFCSSETNISVEINM